MSDTPLSEEHIRRQVQQYLESLRQGGVEWLPQPPPLAEFQNPETPQVIDTETRPPQPRANGAEAATLPWDLSDSPVADAAGTPAPLSLEQRRHELHVLAQSVSGCVRCPELLSTRTQTVFADGQPEVELCCVGEAPGADEDAQGKPFVGAAGQLLNRILAACGFKREEVYICNVIKCRPPGNRTPKPEEAANCREYLTRQLELVKPQFICALGRSAAQNLLNTTLSLERLRGRIHDYKGIPVLVTYHPSFLLPHRQPEKKRDVWEDMKLLLKKMGREVPARTQT